MLSDLLYTYLAAPRSRRPISKSGIQMSWQRHVPSFYSSSILLYVYYVGLL